MTPEKITTNFTRCKDWEERYMYLMELGERYAPRNSVIEVDTNLVVGCQSRVWIEIRTVDQRLQLTCSSDAAIVRGLLALLVIAYSNQSYSSCKQFDVHSWFDTLSLHEHLTQSRTSGLNSIITQLKKMLLVQES